MADEVSAYLVHDGKLQLALPAYCLESLIEHVAQIPKYMRQRGKLGRRPRRTSMLVPTLPGSANAD
jgi:hypothetical protein